MKTFIFVRIILLLGGLANLAFAQGASTSKQILLNVSVVNSDREAINDLKAEHFRLYENKKPLDISHFDKENSPLSVAMLIDASPSMRDKTDYARQGAMTFLEKSNPANEYFLAAFSKTVEVLSPFAEAGKVKDIVGASPYFAKSHNNSSLYDAIVLGVEKLSAAKNRKRVLLVFANGDDNKSTNAYRDVEKLIKEKNIDVYFINFNFVDPFGYGGNSPLKDLIDKVFNGSVFYAGNVGPNTNRASEMVEYRSKFYSRFDFYILRIALLAERLQNQYTIGFKPVLNGGENKWRNIEVKLELEKDIRKKIGDAEVYHRKGYFPLSELVTGN